MRKRSIGKREKEACVKRDAFSYDLRARFRETSGGYREEPFAALLVTQILSLRCRFEKRRKAKREAKKRERVCMCVRRRIRGATVCAKLSLNFRGRSPCAIYE